MPNYPSAWFAAWYGAVVSSISLALALYVALRDRPRLRITVQPNFLACGETAYDPNKRYLVVTVSNRGRRPVTVSGVAFTQGAGKPEVLLGDSMREGPKEIAEGKSITYAAEQDGFPLPFSSLKRVIVCDLAGRVWKRRIPRTVLRAASSSQVKRTRESGPPAG